MHGSLITASMLYNHLACPHRVAMDAFGDWQLRDKVSPFVEMLWARGNKYEAEVIAGIGQPCLDLSGLKGDEKEAVRVSSNRARPTVERRQARHEDEVAKRPCAILSADDGVARPRRLLLVER